MPCPATGQPGYFRDLGRSLQSWPAASTPRATAVGSTGSKGRPSPANPQRKQQPCVRCRDGHAGSADTGHTPSTQHVLRSLDMLALRDNRLQDEPSRARGATPLPPASPDPRKPGGGPGDPWPDPRCYGVVGRPHPVSTQGTPILPTVLFLSPGHRDRPGRRLTGRTGRPSHTPPEGEARSSAAPAAGEGCWQGSGRGQQGLWPWSCQPARPCPRAGSLWTHLSNLGWSSRCRRSLTTDFLSRTFSQVFPAERQERGQG